MRTLGLIGGMSWESTATYYRLLNVAARERLGGAHSAKLVVWSFDFAEVEGLQRDGRWADATARMVDAARALERAGAEGLVVCANTMHRMAGEVQAAVGIPLLHIADATGDAARRAGHRRVGLLGTAYTMEQPFLRERLARGHGLEVLVPGDDDRRVVHDVIFGELVVGRVEEASRARFREIMRRLVERGAEAIVLGCTELELLVRPGDAAVPLLDTTALHAAAAAEWMLAG